MDAADRAQPDEEAERANLLDAQKRKAALDQPGNELCADCNDPIPEDRRRALPSAYRCVGCQAWAERIDRADRKQ
jgi:phage/conjugal plasmid C-4 type zinc finger TraR family protein